MIRVLITALFLTLAAVAPVSVVAHDQVNIRFESGRSSTTISGTIRGRDYIDYVLQAKRGQRMDASIKVDGTNGNGSIYFNILPYGSDYDALFVGSNEGRTARVRLPSDGRWVIRVYLMGNDRDAGKTVGYLINVRISGGRPTAQQPSLDTTWFSRLVGASSAGAVNQLQLNGYRQVDTFESGRNAFGTVWYSRSARQCLQVIIVNGRVDSSLDIQTHPRCR